jgi:pyrimidine operon attenuation protein/uracil phosphoribosyltransferase
MSILAHRKNAEISTTAGHVDRVAVVRFLRKAIVAGARFFARTMQAVSEARLQQAKIEIELYRNRYKHASKNDDDLPVVR